MKVGSLFSGIGGIELGFEREGFETKWFVEQDPFCQAVLRKNFPGRKIYGDITRINWNEVEKVDVLTGGFPCQDLSLAGKRKGLVGARSGLWKEYARAIREIRPKYAVIENVPGLISLGLDEVINDIAEIGYDAEWTTLRASDFGALHKRERIFIIAYPNGGDGGASRGGNSGQTFNGTREKEFHASDCKQREHNPSNPNGGDVEAHGETRSSKEVYPTGKDFHDAGDNEQREHNPSNANGKRADGLEEDKALSGNRTNANQFHGIQTTPPFNVSRNNSCASTPNINAIKGNALCRRELDDEGRIIGNEWEEHIASFRNESINGENGFGWCVGIKKIEELNERADIPKPLLRGSRNGVSNWVDRIKSCGNAVVPQVAQFIARQIKEKEGVM